MVIFLTDNDDLLGRTTLVGIVLAFRKLTMEALHNVTSYTYVLCKTASCSFAGAQFSYSFLVELNHGLYVASS